MPNILFKSSGGVVQKTCLSRTFDEDGSYKQVDLPPEETKMSILGNLFLSEGKPCKVLEIRCKKRKGDDNLVTCMRKALLESFDEPVGMGGTFFVKSGKLKIHVMPDFSPCPITSDEGVANWLKFYEMSSPWVALSYFITKDPVGRVWLSC